MAFFLFLLVNAVLLIRPAELVPELQGIELYFYVIVTCAIVALPDVVRYLGSASLDKEPITLCVLGLLAMVVISPLGAMKLAESASAGFVFFKVVVFYLLFVSVINTPARLKAYIAWLVTFCFVVIGVAVLNHHEVIRLTTLKSIVDTDTDAWGMYTQFERLQFSGIFNDPNELCMWLAAVTPLCLYLLMHDPNLPRRVLWLAALGLFAYGIYLTKSRGGFLALLTGLGTLCWDRFGWRRTLLIGTLALPVLLFAYAGRQTSLELNRQTGQTRIQLWSDWLDRFRGSPVFGEGMSYEEMDPAKLLEHRAIHGLEHLAHNSYLQAFADLGVVGGCLFLGAFYLALWSVYRFGSQRTLYIEPSMKQLQPFLLGTIAAFSMGLLTLTFCFIVPTYIILGLAAAYSRITPSVPAVVTPRFDAPLVGRFALAGIAFLGLTYVFVRVFVNWA